ncbi:hypothetical protein IM793_05575 [Pedobacter sp. MR2016-19]|uniref:hypothetical protein n=1 Tax=Pedobacter sp. MR2016-19 TaxID=2780089 RepID=UPI0010448A87|nr:hypothetical protein [Pedobacter sp. MR2016-19]MBE5318615.1 hypothetical protein [Pedobacter sp. MR2016-19]
MINENFVYSRIGMALVSAQRVEFITGELLKYLVEYDKVFHGITSEEFYNASKKSKNARMMLGQIFGLLKLNPQFSINDEMDTYLKQRNLLVHGFWHNCLNTKSETQSKIAVDFCNTFGKLSNKLESFFKGFMYFLALRHVKDNDHLDEGFKSWDNDFEFFMSQVKQNKSTGT